MVVEGGLCRSRAVVLPAVLFLTTSDGHPHSKYVLLLFRIFFG